MTTVVHSVSLSSSLVKMDERKRPASFDNDEVGPPLKRQATATVNGGAKSHQDADMPGKDELEVCYCRMLQTLLIRIESNSNGFDVILLTISGISLEIPKRCNLTANERIQTRKKYTRVSIQ